MVCLASLWARVLGAVPGCCVVADSTLTSCNACPGTVLEVSNSAFSSIDVAAFENLTYLTHLDLNNNAALTSLPAGVFSCLTSLSTLFIMNNNAFTSLSLGVFDGLISLTTLYLNNNDNLLYLPPGVFDGLTKLTLLNLNNNGLTSLSEGVFDGLTDLKSLFLNDNGLTSLPSGIFDNLTNLTLLNLEGNDLTTLPMGVFDDLTSLTGLSLFSNDLTSLSSDMFDSLTSLTYLRLSRNSLASLPPGVFANHTSLTDLFLNHNNLVSLPVGVFDSLTSIMHLSLDSNDLSSLPSGVFGNLSSLTKLYLGNNALTNLPSGVFGGLGSLTHLYLHGNDLVRLPPGVFDGLADLTFLDLSSNIALTSLPADVFGNLTSLTTLNLNSNDALTSLPVGVLAALTSLTSLDLRYNAALTHLPSGLFDSLSSLATLKVASSPFASSCPPPSPSAINCSMQDGPIPSSPRLCMCSGCPTTLPHSNTSLICGEPHSCSVTPGDDAIVVQEGASVHCSANVSCTSISMFCTLSSSPNLCSISCTGEGSCADSTLYGAWNCTGGICPAPVDVVCLPGQTVPQASPTLTTSHAPSPSASPSTSSSTSQTRSVPPTSSVTLSWSTTPTNTASLSCTSSPTYTATPSITLSAFHTTSPTSSSSPSALSNSSQTSSPSCTSYGTPGASSSTVSPTQTVTPISATTSTPTAVSPHSSTPIHTASTFPSPSPTTQPSPPRSAWALTHRTINPSLAPFTVPRFPAQLACADHCSSPQALILPCPRPGSCLPHSDVRLLTACQPGHRGLACQACDDGWAATSPCTTCRQCPYGGVAPDVVKAGTTAAQIALGLAMSLFAVHGYASAPDRVATSLFSGGLRLAMWYIGMAGQVALLAADTPGTLQATAHTLGHWADVCGMAQPWQAGQTLPPNGTMYVGQPEPAQGADVLGILGALTGRAGVATMPSAGCLVGGGDSRSPHDMANIIMAVYGAMLLCASAAVLWCARPAPGKTWTTILLLLAPAAYMQVVPSIIQGQARIVGLQPVWRGMSSPDDVAGHAADVGGYAASLTLQCLAATVGVLSVLAWRQWRRSEHLLPRGVSIHAYCTKGYRRQYTPQQALRLADATGAHKKLREVTVAAARASERACWGAGRLLPTHAFPALQMALVVLVAVMGSMTTSIVARLVCVGVGVAGSMALVQHRRPWALAELTDLDVLAHGGILVQVVCVGVGTAGGGLATAASIISGIGHVLVLLWLAMAVARGYSGRARALLARVGRRLRTWLPELGAKRAGSGGSGQLGDVADSQVPGVGAIVWALVQRCVRRGEIRPAAARPASDVLSVLGMVREQGLTVETGMADVVGDSGSTLIGMQAGRDLHRSASAVRVDSQVASSKHSLLRFKSGVSARTVDVKNPLFRTTGGTRHPLRVVKPALGSASSNRARDLPTDLPHSGVTSSGGQHSLSEVSPVESIVQRRASAVKAILTPESVRG